MTQRRDITGQRFGRLVAVSRESRKQGAKTRSFWLCACDCGQERFVALDSLLVGDTLSCGCLQRELAVKRGVTHGGSTSRVYRIWSGVVQRCSNPRCPAFHNYGGRGIKMHEPWGKSFPAFAAYVGEPPGPKHSIDRINTNGNYEPGNIRWATAEEQGRNRRNTILVDLDGRTVSLKEATQTRRLPYATVYRRISRLGWAASEALSTPIRPMKVSKR